MALDHLKNYVREKVVVCFRMFAWYFSLLTAALTAYLFYTAPCEQTALKTECF